jgi:hypothetical protein
MPRMSRGHPCWTANETTCVRSPESRVMRKYHARFGGGPMEKYPDGTSTRETRQRPTLLYSTGSVDLRLRPEMRLIPSSSAPNPERGRMNAGCGRLCRCQRSTIPVANQPHPAAAGPVSYPGLSWPEGQSDAACPAAAGGFSKLWNVQSTSTTSLDSARTEELDLIGGNEPENHVLEQPEQDGPMHRRQARSWR